jgi:hypothetical protein
MRITGKTEVEAVLADPGFAPPQPEPAGQPGTMTWLRATVTRLSTGSLLLRAALGAALETARSFATEGAMPTALPSCAEIQAL